MHKVPPPIVAHRGRRKQALADRLRHIVTTDPKLTLRQRRELAAILVPEDAGLLTVEGDAAGEPA
jgi:hypothetical protein